MHTEAQRKALDGLVKRAKEDSKFREKVRQNPVRLLEEAGLPQDAIRDILRDEYRGKVVLEDPRLSAEGKDALLRFPCIWTDCWCTCWCSDCCISDV
jgi:hypothetical protein